LADQSLPELENGSGPGAVREPIACDAPQALRIMFCDIESRNPFANQRNQP